MEIDKKHIVGKVWVNLCRFLLGALFIFSGFVKAVDPLGFFYKIQDYLTAFDMISWFPSYAPLLVGIVLSAIEFSVGVFLFLGIRRKVASALALLLMVVMTPLTLYLALANPVSDCGCFGDAWILTNWQTFGKNVVLLRSCLYLISDLTELERISRRAWKFRKVLNQACLKAGSFWKKEESVRNLHWITIRTVHGRL